jgi:hypothetical protein
MKDFDTKWQRLTALARQAPETADDSLPYGFATRVAARAMEARSVLVPRLLLERLALRGLLAACVLSLASVAYSFTALTGGAEEDLTLAADPLPELLELS